MGSSSDISRFIMLIMFIVLYAEAVEINIFKRDDFSAVPDLVS